MDTAVRLRTVRPTQHFRVGNCADLNHGTHKPQVREMSDAGAFSEPQPPNGDVSTRYNNPILTISKNSHRISDVVSMLL